MKFWERKEFRIAVDISKIIAALVLIAIFYLMFTEVEAIKVLGNDACAYCMSKTGAFCVGNYSIP